jgi:hypothetical protein
LNKKTPSLINMKKEIPKIKLKKRGSFLGEIVYTSKE